jgi:hypothetical protein
MFQVNDRIIHKFSGDKGMIRSLANNKASILFDSNSQEESMHCSEIEKDSDKLSDIRKRALDSSCLIIAKFANGEFKFSSGIAVSENEVLTTLDATILGENAKHSEIWVNSYSSFQKAEATHADRKNNLSILRVGNKNLNVANFGNSAMTGNGNQIIYVNLDSDFRNRTSIGHMLSTNRVIYADKNRPKVHIVNGSMTSESSGGAVIDPRNGDTIGMIMPIVSATRGNGYNVILPSEYIMNWMGENNIDFCHGLEYIPLRYVISSFRETDFEILDREENVVYKSATKVNGMKHRKMWESERHRISELLYGDSFSEVISSYKFSKRDVSNKKYKVEKSSIHGNGIFAERLIDPNEYIGDVVKTGDIVKISKIHESGEDVRTELGKNINYSKNPNAKINSEGRLYACFPISKGSEITLDYLSPEVIKITGVKELRFKPNE